MAYDTKYRPITYDDVLGQEASVAVLRQFVIEGKGYHQSYVFCGQHGSGKTTLGRILARALLCESPVNGNPCDACASCLAMLNGYNHECYEELDAASKSKAEDLERIVDQIQYSTFSGRRRIYLFDESHQLSKKALDVLLKPTEDNVDGSEDKRLVIIFCTTEPEKMRSTIFSRCAPAFVIRPCTSEQIADRLEYVCKQERVPYEREALVTIADIKESHIRDCLKALEGVSMKQGGATQENVRSFLHLGANAVALDVLEALYASDIAGAIQRATDLTRAMSPGNVYGRLAEAAVTAFKASLMGLDSVLAHWDREKVGALSKRGASLLILAERFAAPPYKVSGHTLPMDLAAAGYAIQGVLPIGSLPGIRFSSTPLPGMALTEQSAHPEEKLEPDPEPVLPAEPTVVGGVYLVPGAVGLGRGKVRSAAPEPAAAFPEPTTASELPLQLFRNVVLSKL